MAGNWGMQHGGRLYHGKGKIRLQGGIRMGIIYVSKLFIRPSLMRFPMPLSSLRSLFTTLTALAALGGAVSCTSTAGSSARQIGQTDYLDGLSRPYNQAAQQPAQMAMEDNFSFWDDDGTGGTPRIKLDISEQKAYFLRGDHLVGQSLISTGADGHPTPIGKFKIFFKNPDHKSSVYGWIYDADGNVINKNADIREDKVPPGGKFDNSKMTWYNQFYPAIGMHAGYLPGYPASHGCVRMPEWMAKHFFDAAPLGTPVEVVP